LLDLNFQEALRYYKLKNERLSMWEEIFKILLLYVIGAYGTILLYETLKTKKNLKSGKIGLFFIIFISISLISVSLIVEIERTIENSLDIDIFKSSTESMLLILFIFILSLLIFILKWGKSSQD